MSRLPPNAHPPRVFRNDAAAAVWIFVAIWLAMLACFTYLAWRDGGIAQAGRWAWPLLGAFWLCGTGAATWAAGLPLIRLELGADGVRVRERYLLRTDEKRYLARDLRRPRVESMRDSEGDERFNTVLDLPGERRVILVEAADRERAEQGCEQLFASLRSVCRGFSG